MDFNYNVLSVGGQRAEDSYGTPGTPAWAWQAPPLPVEPAHRPGKLGL